MSTLLTFGLANAVCAALLALVALLVGRFCRRPAVLHGLWLLVLLKLVTPPFWPITVANLPREPVASTEAPAAVVDPAIFTEPQPKTTSSVASATNREARTRPFGDRTASRFTRVRTETRPAQVEAFVDFDSSFTGTAAVAPSSSEPNPAPPSQLRGLASCLPLLSIVWLTGVVGWLVWAAVHIGRFQHLLRHARLAGADVQDQARRLADQMGLRRGPEIWLLPGPLPPLVWAAIGRVRIFFPAKLLDRLDDTERASLLAHELAHVRRRDHWVRWLELIASALYWWYPLVWLARRRLHVHEEECCDAWVVGEVPARTYAAAILNTLDFLAEDRAPLPVMASGLAGVELLKRRLSLIMDGETPKRLSSSAKLALVLAGLLLLSLRPNLAQTQTKAEEIKETKEQPAATKEPAKPAAPGEEPTAFNTQPKNLLGGNNDVWSVAFTPDGKRLAVGGGYWDRPGFVSVWDLTARKRLTTASEPLGVASVAVSPDGKRLAWGSWSSEAKLRDLATGKDIARFSLGSVARVAFSPDSKLLAAAAENKVVKLWDADNGKEIANLQGDLFRWHCVAFSRDGKLVAAGGGDWDNGGVSQVTLWDVKTRKQVGKLSGHARPILGLCFSPDNKTIATGGVDNTVKLWDAASFKELATLQGHENWIQCVTFSPDGKRLVSSGDDASVRVWDVETRKLLARIDGHERSARSAAFSPDGKQLVTGGGNKTLKLWDAATYKEIATLARNAGQGDMAPQILGMTCSPNGKLLANALDDQTIQVLDAASGDLLRTLKGHEDAVQCLAFAPDGKTLASGSPDRTVRLWDPVGGELRRTLTGHQQWVYAVAFSPDGKTLASAGYDKTIRLWDPASGETKRILKGHRGSVRALAFSRDGKTLASAGSDRSIRLWPMAAEGDPVVMKGHEDTVRALAFSPDGKTLASASDDHTVKLWDVEKKSERTTLKGHTAEVTTLTFSPQGKSVVSSGSDNTIFLWDPATGNQRGQLRGHNDIVTAVVFVPDGRRILSAGLDRTIKVWSPVAPPRQARLTLRAHTERAWAVTYSPDNRVLASVSGMEKSGELKLWETASGKQLVVVPAAKGLRCAAFSPDGKTLATGCFDNTVQLREAPTGKVLRVLKGHQGGVNSLSFSPDGLRLATASLDKTAKLWDMRTGKDVMTLRGHDDWVLSVAFAPDGKTIATAGKDRSALLWDAVNGKLRLKLDGHTQGVEAVTFAPDGKTVATASWDQTVRLWDTASGRMKGRLQGQGSGFLSVAFAPDGRTLATASGHFENRMPGELRLWDVATSRPVTVLQGHASGIWCVRFAPNGKELASVSDDGIVKLWAVRSAAPQSTLQLPKAP